MSEPNNKEEPNATAKENLHQQSTSHSQPDIAEELDSLLPNELLQEKIRQHARLKVNTFAAWAYLILLLLTSYIFIFPLGEAYSLACIAIFFVILPAATALWTFGVKNNNLILGARRTTISPIVGSLLLCVPFFNTLILLPVYQELWKTSASPKNWEDINSNKWITIWGILRITALISVIGSIFVPEGQANPRTNFLILYYAVPVSLVCFLLEAAIVIIITRTQNRYISSTRNGMIHVQQQDAS